MARQLYDYWFVQFDFPDENGKPYKTSGGRMVWNEKLKQNIPMNWNIENISKIADVYNGATPSTKEERNYGGNIVWITPKDLSDQQSKFVYFGERNITQEGYNSCSTHMLPVGTVLMSSRAPIGLLSIAKSELCTNQGFKSFVPKKKTLSSYLYYYIRLHIKQIEQLGTGTTFKEVSRDDVMAYPILVPKEELLNKWAEFVFPIDNNQFEIQQENNILIKQRDELLPLLMNGQATVNYHLKVLPIYRSCQNVSERSRLIL
jgi:type I restriction enzyme S subunit